MWLDYTGYRVLVPRHTVFSAKPSSRVLPLQWPSEVWSGGTVAQATRFRLYDIWLAKWHSHLSILLGFLCIALALGTCWIFPIVTGVRFVVVQLYIHSVKFPLKFYSRLNSKLRLPVGLLNCEGSLILTHFGSGLVPRKTVIGINIATSASRSIGNLRWLLDRESVAAICGQASFIVKVERRGFYIHQEIAPGAGAWLVVCHTTLLPWNYHCVVPIFLIWNLKWTVSFEILAAHCRDYLTSRFSDSKWKKKLFFFHYFQCKQCRPDWRTWDFDFPMTTRIFVKNIPQDTLVHLHWNTRVMSRRAPVQQMRVWKTTIPFSYFRTMILTALKIFSMWGEERIFSHVL